MQKRAANETYPLMYANHGGRAQSGELSKESMIREFHEEIGLLVVEDELRLLRTFNDHKSIFDEYIVYKDIGLDDLDLNSKEVESCKWVSLQELSDLIDDNLCFDYKNNDPRGFDSFTIIKELLKEKKFTGI